MKVVLCVLSDRVRLLQGARVWIPHTELVWEGAEVEEDYVSKTIKVKTEDGTVSIFTIPDQTHNH